MALCVSIQTLTVNLSSVGGGTVPVTGSAIAQSTTETIDNCTTYVLQTAQDYKTLSDISAVFADYFQFDLNLSELIMTSMLLSFLSGHILGRVISGLRKAG
jgi:hypothetical protein